MSIQLIVGLGNPGKQYEHTRHNAGFWLLDELVRTYQGAFHLENQFMAYLSKVQIQSHSVFLLKPTTFMNRSGFAVRALAHFYKIPVENILVAHDELDLPVGSIKLKKGGGHAGHNGLRDIQSQMGSPNFYRLRLGIDHPRNLGLAQAVHDYVLSPPRKVETDVVSEMLDRACLAIPSILSDNWDEANRILREK